MRTEPTLPVGVFFAALAINLTVAYGADRPIKIGVLTDMSGPYSAITGKELVVAAQLAIEDFTALVPDRSVELVVGDHMQNPTSAHRSRENGMTTKASTLFLMAPVRRLRLRYSTSPNPEKRLPLFPE